MTATAELINVTDGFAMLSDGQTLDITNWLDEQGEDCEPEQAVSAIAGPDKDGKWWAIPVGQDRVRLH